MGDIQKGSCRFRGSRGLSRVINVGNTSQIASEARRTRGRVQLPWS